MTMLIFTIKTNGLSALFSGANDEARPHLVLLKSESVVEKGGFSMSPLVSYIGASKPVGPGPLGAGSPHDFTV